MITIPTGSTSPAGAFTQGPSPRGLHYDETGGDCDEFFEKNGGAAARYRAILGAGTGGTLSGFESVNGCKGIAAFPVPFGVT